MKYGFTLYVEEDGQPTREVGVRYTSLDALTVAVDAVAGALKDGTHPTEIIRECARWGSRLGTLEAKQEPEA